MNRVAFPAAVVVVALLTSLAVFAHADELQASALQTEPLPANVPDLIHDSGLVTERASSPWVMVPVTGGVIKFRLKVVPSKLVQGNGRGQVLRIETAAVGRPNPVASNTVLEFQSAPIGSAYRAKPILALRKITVNGKNYTGAFPESVCNSLGRSKTAKCGVVGPPISRTTQRRDVRLTLVGMTTDAPLKGTYEGAVRVLVKVEGMKWTPSTEWVPISYVIKTW